MLGAEHVHAAWEAQFVFHPSFFTREFQGLRSLYSNVRACLCFQLTYEPLYVTSQETGPKT
jgi:hypothetical protein